MIATKRTGFVAAAMAMAACTSKTPVPSWRVVFDDLPAPVLSAWAADDGVLYAVGGNARRSFVLRHDADGWWEMDPGTTHALWWVFGFSSSNVVAVGEAGTIAAFDGRAWKVVRGGGAFTLWGIWGASPEQLWAVGGSEQGSSLGPVVLRSVKGSWETFDSRLRGDARLFKVWGSSADDMVVVGDRGLVAHWNGRFFRHEPVPTTDWLLTVFGTGPANAYAVGGTTGAVILRFDGERWSFREPPGSLSANLYGGARGSGLQVVYVGWQGIVAEDDGSSVSEVPRLTADSLHAAAWTGDGFVAVGGDLLGAQSHGTLIARGTSLEPGRLEPWPIPGVGLPAAPAADAGVDGGLPDAGPASGSTDGGGPADGGVDAGPDAGVIGPGGECTGLPCDPLDGCWWIFSAAKAICTRECATAADCEDFGARACCLVPGPQTFQHVCVPNGVGDCGSDGG